MYYRKRQYFQFAFYLVEKSDLFAGLEFLEEVAHIRDQSAWFLFLGTIFNGEKTGEASTKIT